MVVVVVVVVHVQDDLLESAKGAPPRQVWQLSGEGEGVVAGKGKFDRGGFDRREF